MGEVYRAKDTRLGREVAIKALPDAFARDREHVTRFLREGRALASLNHPNIGAIHGLEESGEQSYLVLEFVDGRTLADRLRRGPLPVAEAVRVCRQIAAGLEAAILAYSGAGQLAWSHGLVRHSGIEEMRLVRVDAAGRITPLPVAGDLYGRRVRASPDGRRLVVSDPRGGPWLVDLERGLRSRIVQEAGYEFPTWTPDSRAVVLVRYGTSFDFVLFEARSGATPRRVVGLSEESYPDDVTPDGRDLTYTSSHSGDVRSVPLDGTGPGKVLLRGVGVGNSALSPDGGWLAFSSSVDSQTEVFVERVGGGDRIQVSTGGGRLPRWARDGREVYFLNGDRLLAARFAAGEPPDVGVPVEVATVPDLRGYDVLPGHRQFVALQRPPDAGYVRRLRLALNWTPESERLLEGAGKLER